MGFGQLKPWETLSDRPSGDPVGTVVRTLGLAPNWSGNLLEIASLVVLPGHRGRGIGSKLLDRLVSDATTNRPQKGDDVTLCLLTLRSTVPFYARAGFEVIEDESEVPRPLQAERAAGNVVAGLVAQDECVVMKLMRAGERRRG